MTRTILAAAAALIALATAALAQAVVPPDPQTWQEALALAWPGIAQTVLAVVGLFLTLAIRSAVAMLPGFIGVWIDAKRQKDLHSAIMSKVSEFIVSGRLPSTGEIGRDLLDEVRSHALKSVPQAMAHYGLDQVTAKGDAVLKALATRFGLELDPLRAALRDAGAPVA